MQVDGFAVGCFPGHPCYGECGERFPGVGGAREVVGSKNSSGSDCEELDIGHGEFGSCEFALGILECIDVLGDALPAA